MTKIKTYFDETIYTDLYNYQKIQMNDTEVTKLEQAIEVHGYRGASKKKHNGVVPIRPDDKELWKSMKKYIELEKEQLNNADNNEEFVVDVKVVAHVTNGNRAIGKIYRTKKNLLKLYLLGFTNYNYQLF